MALIEAFLIFSFVFLLATVVLVGTAVISYNVLSMAFAINGRPMDHVRAREAILTPVKARLSNLPRLHTGWSGASDHTSSANLRQALYR